MPDPSNGDVPRHGREPGPGPRAGLGAVPVLVRPDGTLLPGVDDQAAWPAGGGDELSWSFRCDLAGALASLDLPLAGPGDGDQDQLLADLEALDRATVGGDRAEADRAEADRAAGPGGVGAAGPDAGGAGSDPTAGDPAWAGGPGALGAGALGAVADALPAGPGLAAWVAQCPPGQLADADLPAAAAALRRVTSWAQAAELAVVAQIAARSAARDPRTGLGEDGSPAAVTRDAAAQAGLALTLSPGAASWWADLAVTLGWRLPGTGAALGAGEIDLARARIIAEATAVLDDQAARAVEDQVLPAAGGQTYGQLRAAVARAVILADPRGAEERREATERRARVGLYPGDHHTATLTGMNLPAVHAAAAMARLTALARAMQASGAGGGLDLLRSHAYLGLILGTLPLIPPRPDAPPDRDPGPDSGEPDNPGPGPGPGDGGPDDSGPGSGRGDAGPGDGEPGADGRGDPGSAGRPDAAPHGGARRRGTSDPGTPPRPGGSRAGRRRGTTGQASPDDSAPDDSASDDGASDDTAPDGNAQGDGAAPGDTAPDDTASDGNAQGDSAASGDTAPDDSAPDDSATRDRPAAGQPAPSSPDAGDPGAGRSRPPGAPPGSPPGPPGRPRAPDRPDPPRRRPGGPSPGSSSPPGPGDPPDSPDPPRPPGPGSSPGAGPSHGPGPAGSLNPGGTGPAEARSDRLPPGGWPTDADAPPDDGIREPPLQVPGGYADDGGYPDHDLYDEPADPSPIPAWPRLPAITGAPGPPAIAPATAPAAEAGRPPRGLLDLTMPWSALALRSPSPATLTRIGPVTAEQARLLAAAASPATRWRVILTDTHGHAVAVTTIPRSATRPRPRPRNPTGPATGLIGRITITMPITALDAPAPSGGHPLLPVITRTAARILLRLQQQADSTKAATSQPGSAQVSATAATGAAAGTGGCDHQAATTSYRPTTALRDYITARDQTCRYPCCRQPAWHADLDHTRPWHTGGPTCPCNLGALCRAHHILKQLQGWTLAQPTPGVFQWTTPTGRTYTTEPDVHPS